MYRKRGYAFIPTLTNSVLKLAKEEELILCDGKLHEACGRITAATKRAVTIEILKVEELENEPSVQVTLYCSILKNNNFDLIAEKATELGVKAVVPVIAARSVKLNIKTDRVQKIMKEAAEQCGRGIVPTLETPLKFKEALAHAKNNDLNILFDPTATRQLSTIDFSPRPLRGSLSATRLRFDEAGRLVTIGVFIGPEGGWTEEELAHARQRNFKLLTLSPLTFRAETAAIVASYLLCHPPR